MTQTVEHAISCLEREVKNDTFNLTRNDHDAICLQIQHLKKFIQERYEQHRKPI